MIARKSRTERQLLYRSFLRVLADYRHFPDFQYARPCARRVSVAHGWPSDIRASHE
ncbi:hypothetical protein SXCC_01824 [Gluconacetobacter sp. SXCC-1]|nr:hypothetical protein SXCC_01824 [Gluconacetobacter sp. SXCC-1]